MEQPSRITLDRVYKILSFLAIVFLVITVIFKKDQQIIPVTNTKIIEKRIQVGKDSVIIYNTKIVQDKKLIDTLNSKINGLQTSLENFKQKKDTIRIIQTQDKLIGSLLHQSSAKDTLINTLENSLEVRDAIINSQDTLILIQKAKVKKVKRQRNISLLGNVILGTLLIIK